MTNVAKIIRVSVSEAAKLFGVSTRTVRRAVAEGHLGYVVVRGRYKINFESLVKWSQGRPTVRNKLASTGIGQYVERWKIRNKLFSPNPKLVAQKDDEGAPTDGHPEAR
jgi:excisionase family DNA binding protein